MMVHLLLLLRARLRTNALIIAELAISFLVLFGTAAFSLFNLNNYRERLGFSYEQIWEVSYLEAFEPRLTPLLGEAMTQLRQLPQVDAVEILELTPFAGNIGEIGGLQYDGKYFSSPFNRASAGMNQMLGIQMRAGRWFDETDDGAVPAPVVIDTRLAKEVFGEKNPLGQIIHQDEADHVVIGVIDQFRHRGPYAKAEKYLIYPWTQSDFQKQSFLRAFHVAVKPGTTASFEKTMIDLLRAQVPGLTFRIQPWQVYYRQNVDSATIPLYTLGFVCVFLQLMVGLGLLGVLWQNVIGRTEEFGIRRALGASARGVLGQVVGEQLLLTVVGIAIGGLLLAQIPYGSWFPGLETKILLWSFAVAAAVALLLVGLCAGYAGVMAMRLRPADSLRGD